MCGNLKGMLHQLHLEEHAEGADHPRMEGAACGIICRPCCVIYALLDHVQQDSSVSTAVLLWPTVLRLSPGIDLWQSVGLP